MITQTVWTRAARLGSTCRCPQCASFAQGISRRAAASATRRIPRYFTTSTFLYTGIFAAATTFDAKSKKERREQWDQAIADIEDELGQPQNPEKSPVHGSDRSRKNKAILPAFDADSQLIEFGSFLDSSSLRRAKHWAPQSLGGPLDVHHLAPQSLYAPGHLKSHHLHQPWAEVKLERVRLCMDKLQLDIMDELAQSGLSKDAAQYVPATYGNYIMWSSKVRGSHFRQKLGDIARLSKEKDRDLQGWQRSNTDVPLCAYEMDKDGRFVAKARLTNQTLQILFRRHARGNVSRAELLAKVAHTISTSPAPPNVDTFNTLIVGFAHLQEKRLFDHTTAALDWTRVRPNETTLASIFKYDTEAQDYAHFRRWLGRLRGQGIGLYAARKDITITDDNKARLLARPDSKCGTIIQLPTPTPMVFNALIGGVVKFFGFDAALEICRDLSSEGWGLSMAGLCPLLKDCADRADWESGWAVWEKIQALKSKSRKRIRWGWNKASLRWIWTTEKIQLSTYAAMLKLCKSCSKKQIFENVISEATSQHRIEVSQLVQMINASGKKPTGPTTKMISASGKKHTVPTTSPVDRHQESEAIAPVLYCTTNLMMSQEQLHGLMPGNQHLDTYELYERPMSA